MNAFDDDPFGSAVVEPARKAKPREQGVAPVVPVQGAKPITVTLPYPPSANRYWRTRVVFPKMEKMAATYKDGGVKALYELLTKESFVNTYPSEHGKAFKESVGWLLASAGIREPMKARRFQVDIQLWPHRPQDWKTRMRKDPLYWADTVQRLDLDNTRKAINDALNERVFADDKAIWKDSGEVMEPDGRDACVVVTITPLVKANPQGALL